MNSPLPRRFCNVVMKGGITSGVVYPLAMLELAEEFRFKSIGGTSAGAIAAAVTAAAEYRRVTTGSRGGFEVLRGIPAFLEGQTGGQSNLLNLFPPTHATRPLFKVALAFLEDGPPSQRAIRAVVRLVLSVPAAALIAFAPALMLALILPDAPTWLAAAAILLGAVASLAGGFVLLVLYAGVKAAAVTIPRNGFGFSTGTAPDAAAPPGVTTWLHGILQNAAGRPGGPPLTFGDLWTADAPAAEQADAAVECETNADGRSIDLVMITTALSHGRPYRLPFEDRRFFFRPSEFRRFFPGDVVDFLVERSGGSGEEKLLPLPPARDLPVIVATRLSLSFPILFTMVPLYAVDFTMTANQGDTATPERCWFIDGGLSSNFPVTLFDSMFPRWPTFCFDLALFHPDHPQDPTDESKNVWMVNGNGDGRSDQWQRLPDEGFAAATGYVSAILHTIRNWRDNSQLTVPGFRDRIVHVKLNPAEGGLNLNMAPATIRALSARGRFAAMQLRERFGTAGVTRVGLNWNTHRWVRYKTSMALLQVVARHMTAAFAADDGVYPTYRALLERDSDDNPATGNWWRGKASGPRQATLDLLDAAVRLADPASTFERDAPRPKPELRVSPRI